MMIAAAACQNDNPKASTARIPTATVANSMFGEAQVQSSWIGLPWRSSTGITSTPPGSTATTLVP